MARPYTKKRLKWKRKIENNPIKPREGSLVRLKTLEEICRLHGVRYWEDIYDPEIAEEMVENFGNKVEVVYSSGYRSIFEGRNIKTGDTWNYRNEWIVDTRYRMELIPDELWEI